MAFPRQRELCQKREGRDKIEPSEFLVLRFRGRKTDRPVYWYLPLFEGSCTSGLGRRIEKTAFKIHL